VTKLGEVQVLYGSRPFPEGRIDCTLHCNKPYIRNSSPKPEATAFLLLSMVYIAHTLSIDDVD
jgi:hypothetical protein